jgi:dolichyl-phosphate-mannose-protein mannosyltransferase
MIRRVGFRTWVGSRVGLLVVLAVAALLRLVVFVTAASSPQRFWSLDDREYLAVANHLRASYLANAGRLFDFGLRRPPGYPLFVRAIFDVFGQHYAAVIGVQLVLSVATVGVTYWLASLLLPGRFALIAAAALAVDPASIVFANQLLTESLFTLLLTVAVALVIRSWQTSSTIIAAVAGLILGVSILVRPVAEYLPVFLALILVLIGAMRKQRAVAIALAFAFVLGFVGPSGAWALRNYEKTGVPTISTIEGHNMLQYRAVGALVESGQPRSLAQHYVLVRLATRVQPGENAAKVSRAELSVGLAILAEHPIGAFKDWLRGEAKLLLGPARSETSTLLTGRETADQTWLRALVLIDAILTIAILLSAAAGAAALLTGRIRIPALWFLFSTAAYLIIISGGHEAYSRFRVPITPFFVVLGAAALMSWLQRGRPRARSIATHLARPDRTSSKISTGTASQSRHDVGC